MKVPCWWAVIVVVLTGTTLRAFREGDTRDLVVREWGRPASSVVRGDVEYLLFPGRGRVALESGRVREIDLRPSVAGTARGPVPVAVDRPQGAVSPADRPAADAPVAVRAVAPPAAAKPPQPGPVTAPPNRMPAASAPAPVRPEGSPAPLPAEMELVAWAVVVAVHAVVHTIAGLVVLWLVFRYWELAMMARHWVLCAVANTVAFVAVGLVVGVLLPASGSNLSLAAVAGACVPVLTYCIRRLSFSSDLRTAIAAAFMANAGVCGVMIFLRGMALGAVLQHAFKAN